MFNVTIGKKGLKNTWQAEFPETTKCVHCEGESRVGFVVFEDSNENTPAKSQSFVCNLHNNSKDIGGFWLHDCCAVAIYFCKGCLKPTALYNQA